MRLEDTLADAQQYHPNRPLGHICTVSEVTFLRGLVIQCDHSSRPVAIALSQRAVHDRLPVKMQLLRQVLHRRGSTARNDVLGKALGVMRVVG